MAYMQARFKPGVEVPGFATTLIAGGTFVKVSANKSTRGDYQLTTCGLGDAALGVAINDSGPTSQPATSQERLVNVVRRGAIARVTAGGTITAGQPVQSDAVGKAIAQAATASQKAALNTGVVGSNNALTYTARSGGSGGNDIRVQLKDPAGNTQSLAVAVNGEDVVVSLATNGGGAITSTAADVIAAIAASGAAASLIVATNQTGSSGAGVVAAVALSALTGAADAGLGTKLGIAMNNAVAAGVVEVDLI